MRYDVCECLLCHPLYVDLLFIESIIHPLSNTYQTTH